MAIPERIGKYEIVGQIASGGFGVIYEARDPFIHRSVAIKMCSSPDPELRRRFAREAQVVGNLVHPNITLVFDFGYEGEVPYIVQELLGGYDIDELARADLLGGAASVVSVMVQVCDGLQHAHERGIVHRDIKPSNIRLLEDGTVKIMDFGIAKSLEAGHDLTQAGIALGTAGYLAPEQIQGSEVDARSDVFALGVVGYELLTGRRPFDGNTLSNVLFRILNDVPAPPSVLVEGCPPELDAAIRKALAKDPEERFQSAAEMGEVLRRIAADLDALPSDDSTAALRRLVRRMDEREGDDQATRRLDLRPLERGPDAAVIHHTPTPPGSRTRSTVLPVFLGLMAAVTAALGGLLALSPAFQERVFGTAGPPWAPFTPTPTATSTPVPIPSPSPTPTPTAEPSSTPPVREVTARLVVDPPAEVTVDGRPVGSGRISGAEITLATGEHTFTVTLPDYPAQRLSRTVTETTGVITLALDVGLLTVLPDETRAPPGGTATLDGEPLGTIPIVRRTVPSGDHLLTVHWGDQALRQRVVIPRLPAPPVVVVVAPGSPQG